MARDLASSLTPYNYKNMLPLEVLAAVATETLKNEINLSDTPEVRLSNGVKKHVKKSTSVLTLDDIRSLPLKSLIDKFSEMKSDELTKKYSYKCLLLPEKCVMTFKSFGNEKKACDKMKLHLQSHVQQLISENEGNDDISDVLFYPRSPSSSSKQTEKISKKSVKKQQISLQIPKSTSPVSSRTNIFKVSRKEKITEISAKKFKRKLHSSKKHVTEIKNGVGKDKSKMFNSVYLEKKGPSQDSTDYSYQSEEESVLKKLDDDQDTAFCSNYSKHLKDIFFSNDAAKEKLSESEDEQDSKLNFSGNLPEEKNENASTSSCSTNSDQPYKFLEEHDYISYGCTTTSYEEVNDDDDEPDSTNIKYEDPFTEQENAETKPSFLSPAFPYIQNPLWLEVGEVIEIGEVECFCGAEECSRFLNPSSNVNTVKNEIEEMQIDEHVSDNEDNYLTTFYRMNGASSSVLECVDNIVNNKPSSSCVPKSEISANENDENLNMQKFERELALKCIAKLHLKGKKKISDSLMCQICPDKHFTAQATLIHHYRSHAGIKPYLCEICSAKFTRQHSLNYHMLIHRNLSRFTCDVCARTFRHPSHYKEHLRRHTGETPYHCSDCMLHFKTRNTFKRHLKTRHAKLLTATGIEDMGND